MVWAIVCFIAGVVAEQTGPGVFSVYLTALGVAAVALAFLIVPDRMPGGGEPRERGARQGKRSLERFLS
jgi:hypothetical protein